MRVCMVLQNVHKKRIQCGAAMFHLFWMNHECDIDVFFGGKFAKQTNGLQCMAAW